MLSAKEALELYNNSDAEVLKSLKMFDEQIRYYSAKGERKYFYNMGSIEICHSLPALKPLAVLVMSRLKVLGYSVEYCFYGDSYVPRGLADDDGNGTSYKNYGILVRW